MPSTAAFPDETGLAHSYAVAHGSAAAAIEAIERGDFWHDATTRAVLRDLSTMRHAEWKADQSKAETPADVRRAA